MQIKQLQLENFRCYEKINISLHPKYTVLIGINGAGKTTILDSLSIALGGYISNFDGMGSYGINKEDSHYKMYKIGSTIEKEHIFPVSISATADINNREYFWKRSLNGEKGRTTTTDTKEIMSYAQSLIEEVKSGKSQKILPMIAYYGTGRLWMQKREKHSPIDKQIFSRLKGYTDCLDSASNEKLMLKWFERMTYLELQEDTKIPELSAVKQALSESYKRMDDSIQDVHFHFKVKSNELEVTIERKNKTVESLPLRYFSDGIKSTFSMIADIAYRMAVLNPQLLDNILLETYGVVLIDEVDMHLHPKWQTKIIDVLCSTFPNIQFIFTTHSPSVLANIPNEHILVLDNLQITKLSEKTYGRNIDNIFREIMQVEIRPEKIRTLLKNFDTALDNGQIEQAKQLLYELENTLGKDDSDVVEARMSINLEETFHQVEK
ncbi:hypothetical protein FUSO6_01430 [Fusobacterium necrophorum DAB]|uniref:AAA family ATPase n=1 Tax=Fusobacterium necrophorum TaxID=859 RepID=UPI000461BBCB|nr:AAA family ATPase [Fusobacterium necrophorum]KDE69071.1 hypothetical protein FUSO7_12170 [Fusobacterium necrophorum BFTR-2]KDE71252.1 hypothetical protein FUSO6_01430 [Fusobacterium necrophorum DAB]MBR8732807.1 DNA replication and repair protein RecF [Fusobacterium necrophorum]MBR8788984.1 DNA replication and repair protein RecF [Fusobacterium necrophorum]MBR8823048.1 DNA replication and repair protein RecF [Fusobacterium necrophorum]